MLLESCGWSDETEMLAKLLAWMMNQNRGKEAPVTWERLLPSKYVGAATYVLNKNQTPEEIAALAAALKAALYPDTGPSRRRVRKDDL